MSFQGERAARNGLGQLPDLIGAVIPGASHLSPRHPIKITAAMIVLGIVSGWVSAFGGYIAVETLQFNDSLVAASSTAGVCFGVIVFIPWCYWMDRGTGWALLGIPYAAVINFMGFYFAEHLIDVLFSPCFFLLGAIWGATLGGLGMYLQRRGSAGWLLAMSCTMGVCYAASINFVILDGIREMLSHFVDEPLQESMMLGWFFSACHACTAVWLGSLLWDQRVKITFEPREESS